MWLERGIVWFLEKQEKVDDLLLGMMLCGVCFLRIVWKRVECG